MSSELSVGRNEVVGLLGDIRRRGVKIWVERGTLRYTAAKGILSNTDFERLKISREQIVALLGEASVGMAPSNCLTPATSERRGPLSFSQLAHWNLYELATRPAIRQVACALRITGRLDVRALKLALQSIIARHDALRTKVIVTDGTPIQEVAPYLEYHVPVSDLTPLPRSVQEAEVDRAIKAAIMQPVNLAKDPLFVVQLLQLKSEEHVLIIALEHLISDAFSLGLLLRDLFATYVHGLAGDKPSLPRIELQMIDYACQQRRSHQARRNDRDTYWAQRIQGCERLSFPRDHSPTEGAVAGWGVARIWIEKDVRERLRQWCRVHKTTLVNAVCAAYVALVLRWCGTSEMVLRYQVDGRTRARLQNTMGYFAKTLFLTIRCDAGDKLGDLVKAVAAEYCAAYEYAESLSIEAEQPLPELVGSTYFNWIPPMSAVDLSGLAGSDYALTADPVAFAHPMLNTLDIDGEPIILLYDDDRGIDGHVQFPLRYFSNGTMQRFAGYLREVIEELIENPERRVMEISVMGRNG